MSDFETDKEKSPSEEVLTPVEIPVDSLSEEVLNAILDSFIMREGTDYGANEATHAKKVNDIRAQLSRGRIKIVFDPSTESVTLMTEQQWRRAQVTPSPAKGPTWN